MRVKIFSTWLLCVLIISCSSVPVKESEIYNTYRQVPLKKGGIIWEGDSVTITSKGYTHHRFTDELCSGNDCWLDKEPYKEYSGTYTLVGNKIIFNNSHIKPSVRYVVKARGALFLLTSEQYKKYEYWGSLPDYPLTSSAN